MGTDIAVQCSVEWKNLTPNHLDTHSSVPKRASNQIRQGRDNQCHSIFGHYFLLDSVINWAALVDSCFLLSLYVNHWSAQCTRFQLLVILQYVQEHVVCCMLWIRVWIVHLVECGFWISNWLIKRFAYRYDAWFTLSNTRLWFTFE